MHRLEPHIPAIEIYYRHLTTAKLAAKYSMSDAAMRQFLSTYGIKSRKRLEYEKRRRLAIKFLSKGWSFADIAEQLEISVRCTRRMIRRMKLKWGQLSLWPDSAFRIAPTPRMEIVHRAAQKVAQAVQLSLFPEIMEVNTLAA